MGRLTAKAARERAEAAALAESTVRALLRLDATPLQRAYLTGWADALGYVSGTDPDTPEGASETGQGATNTPTPDRGHPEARRGPQRGAQRTP